LARSVFFSFHYQRDIWRASQVRNSWVTKPDREYAGFWDNATWEKVKWQGDKAIKGWINRYLKGASVTVVLIGAETYKRRYVNYEIERSVEEKMGLLGVYIHRLRDSERKPCLKGKNPFDNFFYKKGIRKISLSRIYPTYDYVLGSGYKNFAVWVERAARVAGQ
jgi:hypothetical protein